MFVMMSDVFQSGLHSVEKMGKKKAWEGDVAISGRIADSHGRSLCKMRRELSFRMPIYFVILLSLAVGIALFCGFFHRTHCKRRRLMSKNVDKSK